MPNFAHTFPHSFSSKRPDGLWCCLHTYQTHASLRAAQLSTLPPTILSTCTSQPTVDADLVYRRFDISYWYKHRGANNSCHGRFCRLIIGTSVCPHCVWCVCVCIRGGRRFLQTCSHTNCPHHIVHAPCVRSVVRQVGTRRTCARKTDTGHASLHPLHTLCRIQHLQCSIPFQLQPYTSVPTRGFQKLKSSLLPTRARR